MAAVSVSEIRVEDVCFSYGGHKALNDVSFSLQPGVVGLLGPNGAGKTTLMNLLSTLDTPQGGAILLDGQSIITGEGRKKARPRIGYLPQRFELMESSSLLRNVRYAAWAHGLSYDMADETAHKAIALVGLADMERRPVHSLSGGMRQRAGIACAVVTEPSVLLLDEPTVGLDPMQRIDIRRFLDVYAQTKIVLLSTHMVEDLAAVADRVIVMDHGQVIMQGNMDDLAARGKGRSDALASVWELGYEALMDAERRQGGGAVSKPVQSDDPKKVRDE
ncbi:ATP-binding cassette domain-containing protein [Bifidobacterium sp. ESL0775]|uniref:ABC transporter ATP-binding protein n=1 Tax=Bifidobacterium sp. ESL0775 TaxID=2983230 RepID=UPI0023F7925C|nr:ATP-binding cassette domain-containing protein [Bifidobacterium sp. ESL0775]WEV68952.1 ATP-binding cassette domain-containing protein [Bifidobacterium sp. ESL0775]